MPGAIEFAMCDVYGDCGYGTTERTIPEEFDQTALVDDQKASAAVTPAGQKRVSIFAAILLIACLALFIGAVK